MIQKNVPIYIYISFSSLNKDWHIPVQFWIYVRFFSVSRTSGDRDNKKAAPPVSKCGSYREGRYLGNFIEIWAEEAGNPALFAVAIDAAFDGRFQGYVGQFGSRNGWRWWNFARLLGTLRFSAVGSVLQDNAEVHDVGRVQRSAGRVRCRRGWRSSATGGAEVLATARPGEGTVRGRLDTRRGVLPIRQHCRCHVIQRWRSSVSLVIALLIINDIVNTQFFVALGADVFQFLPGGCIQRRRTGDAIDARQGPREAGSIATGRGFWLSIAVVVVGRTRSSPDQFGIGFTQVLVEHSPRQWWSERSTRFHSVRFANSISIGGCAVT